MFLFWNNFRTTAYLDSSPNPGQCDLRGSRPANLWVSCFNWKTFLLPLEMQFYRLRSNGLLLSIFCANMQSYLHKAYNSNRLRRWSFLSVVWVRVEKSLRRSSYKILYWTCPNRCFYCNKSSDMIIWYLIKHLSSSNTWMWIYEESNMYSKIYYISLFIQILFFFYTWSSLDRLWICKLSTLLLSHDLSAGLRVTSWFQVSFLLNEITALTRHERKMLWCTGTLDWTYCRTKT